MTPGEFLTAIKPIFPSWNTVMEFAALGGLCALLLTPAERFAPAHKQPLVFRKELLLDCLYWFLTPIFTRCLTGAVLALILFAAAWCIGFEKLPSESQLLQGFGPLSRQPLWLQAFQILLISDFVDYWTHRTLHVGFERRFWRIHAIHHSPEEMNWISSSRVHPLNDLITRSFQILPIALLGYSAVAIIHVVPVVAFYVMFLHSNIKWGFGPFRWILVSPAYHRWHHTIDSEGIDKNFAGIFPIWDLLFGTAYFPRTLPQNYGLKTTTVRESLLAHLLFPFTKANDIQRESEDELQ